MNAFKSPGSFVQGGGSVVVDSLFIVTPIVCWEVLSLVRVLLHAVLSVISS